LDFRGSEDATKCLGFHISPWRKLLLIVGIFSPVINWCGGAEWVAVNIINALKQEGHQVIVLTDKPLNQRKFKHFFNREILVDQQIVLPFRFFSPAHYRNLYTDGIRSLILKSKCEVLIDTFSNAILPGADVSYIHHPVLRKVEVELPNPINKAFFLPYQVFLNSQRKKSNTRLIFANSKFTAEAIENEIGITPCVLYPSVSNEILHNNRSAIGKKRNNVVVTIARISSRKNLEIVPLVANSTRRDISFTIAGMLESEEVFNTLERLIRQLRAADRVKILANPSRDQLRELLLSSKVYLHPKIDEHFGISVIEGMAAGCIPVVHDSGGPREFVPADQRFSNVEEAAQIVNRSIDDWSPARATEISESTTKFGEDNFSKQFIKAFDSHFP
jgi:alpha-1,2-mannosyltransferase